MAIARAAAMDRTPTRPAGPRCLRSTLSGTGGSGPPDTGEGGVVTPTSGLLTISPRVAEQGHNTSLSSSSAPTVMWAMLDALEVEPGMRVLEIGTGSGYNAALLSARLGSENVTSIEIAGDLVDAARASPSSLGYTPIVAQGDGVDGYSARAPYDRVLATCAVLRIPAAWIEQTTPGGLICAPMPYGMLRLRVAGDGSASGCFHPTSFAFMAMRSAIPSCPPRPVAELFALACGEGRPRPTRAAAAAGTPLRSALWMLVRIIALPELAVLDLGSGALG